MLTHLQVRDLAIVEALEVELQAGMTALTGETGAGKSILVDALGLALGDRGDAGLVRAGAERTEIHAGFDVSQIAAAREWLEVRELDAAQECVIRRSITRDGRSRGYINGQPVTLQALRELGALLVDIHGQHEHQSLVRRDTQRQLLDDHAGHGEQVARVEQLYASWKRLRETLQRLREDAGDRSARVQLLRYQVQELDALGLALDEHATLTAEHARLANAGRLLESCQRALQQLYQGEELSAYALVSDSVAEIGNLCALDARLEAAHDLLAGALIQLREGADELHRYTDRLELDPAALAALEQRLGVLHDLARKHRVRPEELPALHERLRAQLHALEGDDSRLEGMEGELAALEGSYYEVATALSAGRRNAAQALAERVGALMRELGMPGGRFEIDVDAQAFEHPSPSGLDAVEFLVSANPGQAVKPLSKVASGGELSRISLAIQVVAAHAARIPTLIFDEVDTGIGGGVAEVVGRQLRALGGMRQVLCVTHLPQVAAQAHHHLLVSKTVAEGCSRIAIRALETPHRADELARMLGGVEITEQARAHAREMMELAQQPGRKPRQKPPQAAPTR